jgi:hypothetical protein
MRVICIGHRSKCLIIATADDDVLLETGVSSRVHAGEDRPNLLEHLDDEVVVHGGVEREVAGEEVLQVADFADALLGDHLRHGLVEVPPRVDRRLHDGEALGERRRCRLPRRRRGRVRRLALPAPGRLQTRAIGTRLEAAARGHGRPPRRIATEHPLWHVVVSEVEDDVRVRRDHLAGEDVVLRQRRRHRRPPVLASDGATVTCDASVVTPAELSVRRLGRRLRRHLLPDRPNPVLPPAAPRRRLRLLTKLMMTILCGGPCRLRHLRGRLDPVPGGVVVGRPVQHRHGHRPRRYVRLLAALGAQSRRRRPMRRAGAAGAPLQAAHVAELVEPGVGHHVGETELAPAHGPAAGEGSLRCTRRGSGGRGPEGGPGRLHGGEGRICRERGRSGVRGTSGAFFVRSPLSDCRRSYAVASCWFA